MIARVERVTPGEVTRALESHRGVGGKSLNVARFVAAMRFPVRVVVLGDAPMLAAVGADPLLASATTSLHPVPSPVTTRTDIAIVDGTGAVTVVNGTSEYPGEDALGQVVARTLEGIGHGDVLVLAGSSPAGTDDTYRLLGRAAAAAGARVIVDASGPWLRAALAAAPFALKISVEEATTGGIDAASAPVVAVTEGPSGLRSWDDKGRGYRVLPPPGLSIVNPLGAGDAVTAGLAIELARGGTARAGLVLGTAMAAARLRHLEIALDPSEVATFLGRVMVTHRS